ncbi:MAG: hypothetical protein F4X13_10300 [Gammaproteobacteria bacterium]|nr:hypothetical protein [Gammaproteobacteria bacterium]
MDGDRAEVLYSHGELQCPSKRADLTGMFAECARGLRVAAIIMAGLLSGPASAQEIPESSLNSLFLVGDDIAVDMGGRMGGVTGITALSVDVPPRTQDVDDDPNANAGAVAVLSVLGTVAGDFVGLYVLFGCVRARCDDNRANALMLAGAAIAVGTPAAAAVLGGGDSYGALIGSGLGLFLGVQVAREAESGQGLLVALGIHAAMTALGALDALGGL